MHFFEVLIKNKSRFTYALLALVTIMLGLMSRSNIFELPIFIATYSGDALWALLVFWLFRVLSPTTSSYISAVMAICFSFSIEISQLYHAQWIDNIRATRLGSLVLGFGFKFSDLVCYCVGICFGVACDIAVLRRYFQVQ